MYRSTNKGGSCTPTNKSLYATRVSILAIDPKTPAVLYAGTYRAGLEVIDGGVFKSTNSGESWSPVNTGLNGFNISSLAIDPAVTSTLYAATYGDKDMGNGRLFKSTNGGENWSPIDTNLVYPDYGCYIRTLVIDPATPSTVYAGAYIDNASSNCWGVYKSTNAGGTWIPINTGLPETNVNTLAVDPKTPATLYAGTMDGGIFKSTDGGGNWKPVNNGLTGIYVKTLVVDPAAPATLYAGTSSGVFKSTNGGESWNIFSAGLTTKKISALAVSPQRPGKIYAGTEGGGVFVNTPLVLPIYIPLFVKN